MRILKEKIGRRNELRSEIAQLNSELRSMESQIKEHLYEHRMFEFLDVNWSRLRRFSERNM